MTREEADFIGGMNMCDEISNEAYKKIMCHCEEREPCEDCISRKSLKHKLQEHHDFFVNAYGGFSNLPQNDKSRVDEIINCIAMVVNEPPVTPQPKIGRWIKNRDCYGNNHFTCPFCENDIATKYNGIWKDNYCSNCGAKMQESEE